MMHSSNGEGRLDRTVVPEFSDLATNSSPYLNFKNENSPRSDFIGRKAELANLTASLDAAMMGKGQLAMIAGEPGIGKTRIVEELALYAKQRGFYALWGRCYEEEAAPPFSPWMQLLRAYIQDCDPEKLAAEAGMGAAYIAEIIPELHDKLPGVKLPPVLEPDQARFRLFDSIATFLKNIANSRPLALLLDDLHWSDKPSLLLLEFLSHRIAESRILITGAYRDVEISRQHPLTDTLARLSREPMFRRVSLEGLHPEDAPGFIKAMSSIMPKSSLAAEIHSVTEGNPFFMTEVIRHFLARGELTETTAMWPAETRIPEGVREAIWQRLNRLSKQCNRVLTTVSVICRDFDFRLLRASNDDLSEEQLLEVLDEALQEHVIEELAGEDERYHFSHSLIRHTLMEQLSASRRARLHARLGESLELIYQGHVEDYLNTIACHFTQARSVLGTEKMVHYSLLAGKQALSVYAYDEALAHFQRALDAKNAGNAQNMDAETAELTLGLGMAQAALFDRERFREAVINMSRAFDYYVGAGDISRAASIAQYHFPFWGGTIPEVFRLIKRGLELVPPGSREAARLLCSYGRVAGIYNGDYESAQNALTKALDLAQHFDDTTLTVRTLVFGAIVDYFHLHLQESLHKFIMANQSPKGELDLRGEAFTAFWATLVLATSGDLQNARITAKRSLNAAEQVQDTQVLAAALWGSGAVSQLAGDWKSARECNDGCLKIASSDVRFLGTQLLLESLIGNTDSSNVFLKQILQAVVSSRPWMQEGNENVAFLIPLAALFNGTDKGLDIAEATAQSVLSSPSVTPLTALMANSGLAIAALLRGNLTSVARQYSILEPVAGGVMLYVLAGDHLLGILSKSMGRLEETIDHFEKAEVLCRKGGYLPSLAWLSYDYAAALIQRNGPGDYGRASDLLNESLNLSQELGMRPLMEKANALQNLPDFQSAAALSMNHGLTPRELEVLRLIAIGKTNREIAAELVLSVKTVDRHVSNIFSKTGASNRTEASLYASRSGLVT